MLNEAMRELIRHYTLGSVATVTADGMPAVSPKGTFVVLDAERIAFGNIRSPGTLANLRHNPAIEVCFSDVLRRRAVRAAGHADIVQVTEAEPELIRAFEESWADYLPHMSDLVVITLTRAELVTSPAYDLGITDAELVSVNLAKLQALQL